MLSVLRQRNFALLWSGGLLSQIGTAMLQAALPYFVYATSHSVMASGAALISETVPAVVLNTVGGVYADRLPRKLVMAAGDGARGLVLFPLVAAHGPSTLWIVYATAFLSASVAAFAGPFGSAAIPHLVSTDELPAANAAFSAATSAATFIGAPLGGLLLQRTGLSTVVVVDCLSFLIPTVTISLINVPLEDTVRSAPDQHRNPAQEWRMGWQYVRRIRTLRFLFLAAVVTYFANGIVGVVIVPFVRHVLHGSASFYSLTLTITAISGTVGGLIVGPISARVSPAALAASCIVLFGLGDVAVAATAIPVMMLVTSVSVGVLALIIVANLNTLLQTNTADRYRGRVSGTYTSAIALSGLCGSTAATLVTDRLGIRLVLFIGGSLFVASGILAWITLGPSDRAPRRNPD